MSDEVSITCPRCKFQWKQSLDELEKLASIYKPIDPYPKPDVEEYRTSCPKCGTYVVIEVAEEDIHG